MYQRYIRLEHRSIAKLIGKMFQGRLCLCHDKQSGSIAIETMHDAGPHARAAIGKLLKMVSERVRQRARVNSSGWMDHQTGGFVNDDECLVFVNDLDRDRFGCKTGRSRRDQFDFQLVVFAKFVGRFGRLAVYQNVFCFDETLEPCATPALNPCG